MDDLRIDDVSVTPNRAGTPVSGLLPNLPELAQRVEYDSDAGQLVAAFAASSLEDMRANLRKIADAWEQPADSATPASKELP